ncbi:MAG: hypothetical protein O2857_26345 [Planctomycetota bacterium]|nr:hypothetical protein [Planctomycetota bacterium]
MEKHDMSKKKQDINKEESQLTVSLKSNALILRFGKDDGLLRSAMNIETNELYEMMETDFSIEGTGFEFHAHDMALCDSKSEANGVRFVYCNAFAKVEVYWRLMPHWHFAEKHVFIFFKKDCDLTKVAVSQLSIANESIAMVCYKYPQFDILDAVPLHQSWGLRREPDTEPIKTWFGRTTAGGFFTGLEMPFDRSAINGKTLTLAFTPNLKIRNGEPFTCEPMYIGVYRREAKDDQAEKWKPQLDVGTGADIDGFNGAAAAGLKGVAAPKADEPKESVLPLPSESHAMTAMTSEILGPPRHGFNATLCACHSEMVFFEQYTAQSIEEDVNGLKVAAECGLEWMYHVPDTLTINALREGDKYRIAPIIRRFILEARKAGFKMGLGLPLTNTHPWSTLGTIYRPDRPEWARKVEGDVMGGINADNFKQHFGNCMGCKEFNEWYQAFIRQAIEDGHYESVGFDGDFWGSGAYYHTTIPVTCLAENHAHLPGDSNYACQKALDELYAMIRKVKPDCWIGAARPNMDLGVWSLRNVDSCFTTIETGTAKSNIAGGNEIRTASRIRVNHHFFPHWLDQSFIFPCFSNYPKYRDDLSKRPLWPSDHIDYILLSALSCNPTIVMNLPVKSGFADDDKQEIRKWIDWARKNEKFLMVRKDLFAWPSDDAIDGSAHICENEGLVFLFNPSPKALTAEFCLSDEETGWTNKGKAMVYSEYPADDGSIMEYQANDKVTWEMKPESAVVLRIK